ncbi:MAG TPA: type II toxin-antitoxin system mRNA interferase toxin, RelE/StbE family [Candidatus Wolfebacteria bacterium]|nr:type II toxin-antitoxin system mRNA interferase toxin, RelE/StbE family [Candidatus Wolfebacteria bacterium]
MPKITKSHITPYFEKQFEKLPKNLQKIAARKLLLFEGNSSHPSLNTHKLKGALSGFWAFSINDNFRVMFRFLKNNEVIYYDIDTHNIYK